ncbi:hypothetical protein JCM6882_008107 [Rhodosporidiobolus microsporus]
MASISGPPLSTTFASSRLNHPHYHLNSLLSLVFPYLLLRNLPATPTPNVLLIAAPVLVAFSAALRRKSDNLESLHESTTFQLRIFNLFGLFFTRHILGFTMRWVWMYLGAWMLVSFFCPQPAYLGPKKLTELTSDEFDTQILLIPAARDAASAFASAPLPQSSSASSALDAGAKIVELPEDEIVDRPPLPLGSPDVYNLVLFHIDFSKKSRDLELTLSRLSHVYTSPTLRFSLLSGTASNDSTFYDLGLSTSPTTTDLPLLRLYKAGKVVGEMPRSEEAVKAERRAAKKGMGAGKTLKGKKGKRQVKKPEYDESGSDTDSEDEREIAQEVAMSRYRWDSGAEAIVREFRLGERSGLGEVPLERGSAKEE